MRAATSLLSPGARCAMAMDPLGGLHQQQLALNDALAENRRQLKKARAAADAQARVWQLTPNLRHAALIIYVLSGYDAEPAARYLMKGAERRRWPAMLEDEVRAMVEDLFLAVDEAELAALTDATYPSDPLAMEAAAKCVEEWKLVSWARRQNTEKGVAPSTDALLQRVAASRLDAGHPDPHGRGTTAEGSARMWASRFIRRWGGRYGAIGASEDVPLDVMRNKAPGSGWGRWRGEGVVAG